MPTPQPFETLKTFPIDFPRGESRSETATQSGPVETAVATPPDCASEIVRPAINEAGDFPGRVAAIGEKRAVNRLRASGREGTRRTTFSNRAKATEAACAKLSYIDHIRVSMR